MLSNIHRTSVKFQANRILLFWLRFLNVSHMITWVYVQHLRLQNSSLKEAVEIIVISLGLSSRINKQRVMFAEQKDIWIHILKNYRLFFYDLTHPVIF